MSVKHKKHKKIEESVHSIFKTKVLKGIESNHYIGIDGVGTIVDEPLVRQQIIQLAKLCEETSVRLSLKAVGNKVVIEFW
mgnify:CR=1 FL=1